MSDLLKLAQQYLEKVKRSGNEDIMAVCPFHRKADGTIERTPSFAMNIHSGLWYCHSCHARGNLRTFLQDIGLSKADIDLRYKPLLEEVAKHAPVKADPLRSVITHEPLPEGLLVLFEKCPVTLLEEGYPQDLLWQFEVGFDEKHNRITFPLRDAQGRLIGISGRAVGNVQPRYKVYDREFQAFGLPERKTEKRAILWNFHKCFAEQAFQKKEPLIIVEGFKAVMRVAQAGVHNVVGLLGSFMSEEQQWLLERASCPLVFMLDNNDAGRGGQFDACWRLTKTTPQLYVVTYDGNQPSDLTPEDIQVALRTPQPFPVWANNTAIKYQIKERL